MPAMTDDEAKNFSVGQRHNHERLLDADGADAFDELFKILLFLIDRTARIVRVRLDQIDREIFEIFFAPRIFRRGGLS